MESFHIKLLFTTFLVQWTSATNPIEIERLAEKHPYIVPLLGKSNDYLCTGSIIRSNCVLTSARCLDYKPHYVSVGTAVVNPSNSKSLVTLGRTIKYKGYEFQINNPDDPRLYEIHSNIGVAMLAHHVSDSFIQMPVLAKYFTADLKSKSLLVVGYGKLKKNSSIIALQSQMYQYAPCLSTKWNYCLCGVESASTHDEEFGEGAPVILDSHIVAVTAFPCGAKALNATEKYNVFTVISPYFSLIEDPKTYFEQHGKGGNGSTWDKIKRFFTRTT